MDGTLVVESDGKVTMLGVDYGGKGEILAQNEGIIVVKWPGHMGWYVRGERKYYSPKISVYRKVKTPSEAEWRVEELIWWNVKRKSS